MEYLKGFYKKFVGNRYLRQWTYYQLQQYIEEAAKKVGIDVVYVDPKYTSQTCSKCGCVHKENRPKTKEKGAEYFGCIECGFETNADFNAARNIAMSNKIITE
jgi:transposase